MSSIDLYTIGYQGRALESLVDLLRSRDIKTLVDVREVPRSRIRGFSKTRLSEALTAAGIDYVSARELGSPSHLRREYRDTGDWVLFAHRFDSYLLARQEDLDRLCKRVCEETACLLCFERKSSDCHRSIVARAIARMSDNGLRVTHL